MKPRRSLVYYITAHGYGHGVRSCDIINALRKADPELCILVVTDLPVEFLRSRVDLPLDAYRAGSFDVGMVQLDSIRVDVDASLRRAVSITGARERLIEQERAFLREHCAGLVVCDIPSIPIEAAKAEGLTAMAVGNFAWDWIYEEFIPRDERWRDVVDIFRHGYSQCDLLLQLPFSEPMSVFPRRRSLPLLSVPGKNCRAEIARRYGIDAAKTWVLLSFTTLDWDAQALETLSRLDKYVFLTVLPLAWSGPNLCAIDRHLVPFSSTIATADIVVSKPGYGILSECVANNKPLVFAERTDFREYPILEEAVKKYLCHQHIPSGELYAGNLGPYLELIATAPTARERLDGGGDRVAANIMLERIGVA